MLADGAECKVVTGVDDHSRYCVIASVVPRATGRAVCLAFAAALQTFGIPDEVLTDIQSGWRGIRADLSAGGEDRCRPAPARHRYLTEWSA
jgi:hypothetical protein